MKKKKNDISYDKFLSHQGDRKLNAMHEHEYLKQQ